ncbi:unnamed protein product [Eruca vesicaria subsp. sativa]|uniref:Uncharacterized protein n=1 Tax=Eruca vesicaria subsp. sativa TaxID=29727 RepID=A0ABC8K0I6_ERUVS|nr:unnamed protein product [Eruca vesicaria subsp. sativa]
MMRSQSPIPNTYSSSASIRKRRCRGRSQTPPPPSRLGASNSTKKRGCGVYRNNETSTVENSDSRCGSKGSPFGGLSGSILMASGFLYSLIRPATIGMLSFFVTVYKNNSLDVYVSI